MNEIIDVFAQEAREQLAAMEAGLLQLDQGDRDPETLNAIFRAAHTIKGASGVAECTAIEKFTHILENLLDRLRNHELAISGELVTLLLQGCDHIGALLADIGQGRLEPEADLAAAGATLAGQLREASGLQPPAQSLSGTAAEVTGAAGSVERDGDGEAMNDCWHISIRFGRDVLKMGMEPLAFLRYLLNLGEIAHVETLADALPEDADAMDPESCYLGFEIAFRSHATKEQIENVFAFCRDECELHILPPNSKVGDYLALIERLPEE
ncbi:MAG: Hpt domain-containing protein, partial [Rhodocyclaceae bacterium]|nr:Hpt domain-containing protein [Rhodocyclaceae bacterium]